MMEEYLIGTALAAIVAAIFYFVYQDRKAEADERAELPTLRPVETYAEWEGPLPYHVAFNVGALKYRIEEMKVLLNTSLFEQFKDIVLSVYYEGYEPEMTDDWTQGRDCENQMMRVRDLAQKIGIPHDAISLVTCKNLATGKYHVMGCLHCTDGDLGFDNDGSVGPFEKYFGKYTDLAIEGVDGKWKRVHRI